MKTFIACLIAVIPLSTQAQHRVTYDDPVSLTGVLTMQRDTYPFEGKEVETEFTAIALDTELMVYPGPKSQEERPAKTKLVQVVVNGDHVFRGLKTKQGYRAVVMCRRVDPATAPLDFTPIVCDAQDISVSAVKPALPYYEPNALCRRLYEKSGTQTLRQACLESEQQGYDSLKQTWPLLSNSSQLACRRFVESGDTPSYALLDACAKGELDSATKTSEFQFKR